MISYDNCVELTFRAWRCESSLDSDNESSYFHGIFYDACGDFDCGDEEMVSGSVEGDIRFGEVVIFYNNFEGRLVEKKEGIEEVFSQLSDLNYINFEGEGEKKMSDGLQNLFEGLSTISKVVVLGLISRMIVLEKMRNSRSNVSKRRRETRESSSQGQRVGIEAPRPQEELVGIQAGARRIEMSAATLARFNHFRIKPIARWSYIDLPLMDSFGCREGFYTHEEQEDEWYRTLPLEFEYDRTPIDYWATIARPGIRRYNVNKVYRTDFFALWSMDTSNPINMGMICKTWFDTQSAEGVDTIFVRPLVSRLCIGLGYTTQSAQEVRVRESEMTPLSREDMLLPEITPIPENDDMDPPPPPMPTFPPMPPHYVTVTNWTTMQAFHHQLYLEAMARQDQFDLENMERQQRA
nr:hypothetical protein Itr_chr08CG12000 [Ipomoea trifida]